MRIFFQLSIYMQSYRNYKPKGVKKQQYTQKYKGGSAEAAEKIFAEYDKAPSKFSAEKVKTLIGELNKTSIKKKNKNGSTLLHVAIAHPGDECKEIVELLLAKGAVIDQTNKLGWTALHMAVDFGKPRVVKLLLEKGAKTDIVDRSNNTPLDMAKERAKLITPEIVRLLEEKR